MRGQLSEEDEKFLDESLDEIEKSRRLRGMCDLEQTHRSKFFRKERNLDDGPDYAD
jgi:hypothetical protein